MTKKVSDFGVVVVSKEIFLWLPRQSTLGTFDAALVSCAVPQPPKTGTREDDAVACDVPVDDAAQEIYLTSRQTFANRKTVVAAAADVLGAVGFLAKLLVVPPVAGSNLWRSHAHDDAAAVVAG